MILKNTDKLTLAWIKTAIFVLALLPFIQLLIAAVLNALGANPIEKITHTTGYWALTLLLVTLAVTPLRRLTGWHWLIKIRRMLGLFAFFYASLHFATYLVLDQFFDWTSIAKDIIKRPYITVGFPAFLMLIPLAVTSNNLMLRKLGGKRWQLLHRTVYLCTLGGVIHYWWLVKKDLTNPITFAVLLILLLLFRFIYWLNKKRTKTAVAS